MAFEIKNNVLRKYTPQENIQQIKTDDGYATVLITTTTVVVPDGIVEIGNNAFAKCKKIEKVILPNGLKTISKSAFKDCNNLVEIVVPDTLENIGAYAFSGCSKLKVFQIPDTVKVFGKYAFNNCSSLEFEDFTLPKGLTEIPEGLFRGTKIKKITVPSGVKRIGHRAFHCCYSLEKVDLPDGLETIEWEAFYICASLKEINFPDTLTSIGHCVFNSCCSLESIALPEKCVVSGWNFTGTSITEFKIPKSWEEIPAYCFASCKKLTMIEIPKTVKKIGLGAFKNVRVENIILNEGLEEIGEYAFLGFNVINNKNGGLLLPKTLKQIGRKAFFCYTWEKQVKLLVYKGSYAERYAKENGIEYEIVD